MLTIPTAILKARTSNKCGIGRNDNWSSLGSQPLDFGSIELVDSQSLTPEIQDKGKGKRKARAHRFGSSNSPRGRRYGKGKSLA